MYPMNLQLFRRLISSNAPKNVILDTDAYNEVDDQFCIAYCMRAPEKLNLLSINAAPFLNPRSTSPADGMEKSYREILRIMKLTDPHAKLPVFRGSDAFLPDRRTPIHSEAAENIIQTVKNSTEPVIVIAIGAITNVASALLMAPELAGQMGIIWLGGHGLHYPDSKEFNMQQDVPAAQAVFDSGVPLLQIPCGGVCSEFVTTVPELEFCLRDRNELCNYLIDNVAHEANGRKVYSRIIWDVTAAAMLICPAAGEIVEIPRPVITPDSRYATDLARPHYLYVRRLRRDRIYEDLFDRLSK